MTGFSNTYGPVRPTTALDSWSIDAQMPYNTGAFAFPYVAAGSLKVTGPISDTGVMFSGTAKILDSVNNPGNVLTLANLFTPTDWSVGTGALTLDLTTAYNGAPSLKLVPSAKQGSLSIPAAVPAHTNCSLMVWVKGPAGSVISLYLLSSTNSILLSQSFVLPNSDWNQLVLQGTPGAAGVTFDILANTTLAAQSLWFVQPGVFLSTTSSWGPGDPDAVGLSLGSITMQFGTQTLTTFTPNPALILSPSVGVPVSFSQVIQSAGGSGSIPPGSYTLSQPLASNANPYIYLDALAGIY